MKEKNLNADPIKLSVGGPFDFLGILFTHGLDKTLDYLCTLSVFSLD